MYSITSRFPFDIGVVLRSLEEHSYNQSPVIRVISVKKCSTACISHDALHININIAICIRRRYMENVHIGRKEE